MRHIYRTFFVIASCLYAYSTSLCENDNKLDNINPVDLTIEISQDTPCVPKKYSPKIEDIEIKNAVYNDTCYPHMISIPSGGWTSIIAPSLSDGNWKNVNTFPLTDLLVEAIVIDLSQIISNKGAKITIDDIKSHERKNSAIKEKCFVILYTGWSKNWDMEQRGYMKKYPILTKDAANYLIKKSIVGIGIDAPHIDNKLTDLEVQEAFFTRGMYIVKNLSKDVEQIVGKSGKIIIAPLKFENCNESPARVIFIPSDKTAEQSIAGKFISKVRGLISDN